MGGKAQRTAGNAKPTSSGRIGELLTSSNFVGNIVTFSSLTNQNTLPLSQSSQVNSSSSPSKSKFIAPTSFTINDPDEEFAGDDNLRLILKRLNKKDATTKIKAMKELTECIESFFNDKLASNERATFLNIWVKQFVKCSIDGDWQLREATFDSLDRVAMKLNRNIAPHIKTILPIWLIGQFDTYTTVSKNAQRLFNQMFSRQKQIEAMRFCKNEIINLAFDIILEIPTLKLNLPSNNDSTSRGELAERKDRLTIGCLGSLHLLMTALKSDVDDLLVNDSKFYDIINSEKFWRLASHNNTSIRLIFYTLLNNLITKLPNGFLTSKSISKLYYTTFCNLNESNPNTLKIIWAIVLHLCEPDVVEICSPWDQINFLKVFQPHLFSVCGGKVLSLEALRNIPVLLKRINFDTLSQNYQLDPKKFILGLFETIIHSPHTFYFPQTTSAKTNSLKSSLGKEITITAVELVYQLLLTLVINYERFGLYFDRDTIQAIFRHVTTSIENTDFHIIQETSMIKKLTHLTIFSAYLKQMNPTIEYLEIASQATFSAIVEIIGCLIENFLHQLDNHSDLEEDLFEESVEISSILVHDSFHSILGELNSQNCEEYDKIELFKLLNKENSIKCDETKTQNIKSFIRNTIYELGFLKLISEKLDDRCIKKTDRLNLYLLFKIWPLTEQSNMIFQKKMLLWDEICEKLTLKSTPDSIQVFADLSIILTNLTNNHDHQGCIVLKCLDKFISNENFLCAILKFENHIAKNQYSSKIWTEKLKTRQDFKDILSKISLDFFNNRDEPESLSNNVTRSIIENCLRTKDLEDLSGSTILLTWSDQMDKQDISFNEIENLVEKCNSMKIYEFSISDSSSFQVLISKLFYFTCSINLESFDDFFIKCIKSNRKKEDLFKKLVIYVIDNENFTLNSICVCKKIRKLFYVLDESIKNECLRSIFPPENVWKSKIEDCSFILRPLEVFRVLHFATKISDDFASNPPNLIDAERKISSLDFAFELVCELSKETVSVWSTFVPTMNLLLASYVIIKSARKHNLLKLKNRVAESFMNVKQVCSSEHMKTISQNLVEACLIHGYPYQFALNYFLVQFQNTDTVYLTLQNILPAKLEILNERQVSIIQICGSHFNQSELNETLLNVIEKLSKNNSLKEDSNICSMINLVTTILHFTDYNEEILDSIFPLLSVLKNSIFGDRRYEFIEYLDVDQISFICSQAELYKILCLKYSDDLSIEEWDLIFTSITHWISLIASKTSHIMQGLAKPVLCTKIFGLIYSLISLVKKWKTQEFGNSENPMRQRLCDDWGNFHSSNIYEFLMKIYVDLARQDIRNERDLYVLKSISKIVIEFEQSTIISNPLEIDFDQDNQERDGCSKIAKNVHGKEARYFTINEIEYSGFIAIFNLLKSNQRVALVSAHSILRKMISQICINCQQNFILNEGDDPETIFLCPPKFIMSLLMKQDSLVQELLSVYRIEDVTIHIDKNSDAYNCILSYLLVWDIVIQLIVGVEKEFRQRIIQSFNEMGIMQRLLNNLFRLIPSLGEIKEDDYGGENTLGRSLDIENFLKSPLCLNADYLKEEIELVALHIFFVVSLKMPITVRQWYNIAPKRVSDLVNKYTIRYVSPVICSIEMDTVQKKWLEKSVDQGPFVVKARPNAREVFASYLVDEFQLELTIRLPPNYPLLPVQIDGGKRIGATDTQWRNWLLRLTMFLTQKNEVIMEGLKMWRRGLEKKFEGLDDCMICFSLLDSYQKLPKHSCQNCKKGVHSSCLYEWFRASGNSTCPLCRSLW